LCGWLVLGVVLVFCLVGLLLLVWWVLVFLGGVFGGVLGVVLWWWLFVGCWFFVVLWLWVWLVVCGLGVGLWGVLGCLLVLVCVGLWGLVVVGVGGLGVGYYVDGVFLAGGELEVGLLLGFGAMGTFEMYL
ncbi:hypothetical protein, partial [Pseudomonas syringae group genomosp. 7]|uniref:hypothetical protein n=1 Tax=Pseudomonas syringae group genomosp. 7 TaxID=251699 RepID=UPI00376FD2A9